LLEDFYIQDGGYMKLKKILYSCSLGYTPLKFFLGISITNSCNRSCIFCLYQSPKLESYPLLDWVRKQPKMMDIDKFEKSISKLGWLRYMIRSIGLTGKGEPLLHPNFMRFCYAINNAKIKFSITTNGDLLEKFINPLSELEYLTFIRVSIYELKTLNKINKLYSKPNSYPNIIFHNMTGEHINGIYEGFKLWSPGLDDYCTMPKGFNKIKSCTKSFSYLTINPDGSITTCNSFYELGNAFEKPLYKIWNGFLHRKYNRLALKMKNIPSSDCSNCGFNLYTK
jgi:radical SAM protein with 4Fe4S-binding SPASM domain